ncbi:unnamed protein product [Lepeophtheirus salmonis]|uniref:(salmon louse) hypothetical protein n=1 Tax=Lepeophtheirus salmonis TaxID=72036 RepID=A0A7R8CHL6_LEPSM|nr:unnamed protein product [Lepeophtheirus salmonis]CAF2819644.1 unnamed protein product [Lepeophtheirus salmonis]
MPLVYTLMVEKSEISYTRLGIILKDWEPSLAPNQIMTDFERATINSFANVLPIFFPKGMFFLKFLSVYCQVYKVNDLPSIYENDPNFALKMRMLASLAFLPLRFVEQYFEHLSTYNDYPEEPLPVLDYLENTWIGRPTGNITRRPPRFSNALWNCYDSAKDGSSSSTTHAKDDIALLMS